MKTFGIIGTSLIDQHVMGPHDRATCNKVKMTFTHGGSMRNLCEHLARLEQPSMFVSIFGNDDFADRLVQHLKSLHIAVCEKRVPYSTPIFLTFEQDPQLRFSSIDANFFFQAHDYLPKKQLALCDVLISDTKVFEVLEKMAEHHVLYTVGTTLLHEKIQAVILSEKDSEHSFEWLCEHFASIPLFIYTQNDQPIRYVLHQQVYTYDVEALPFAPMYGCGDAFAAAFLQAYLQHEDDVETALHKAITYVRHYIESKSNKKNSDF